MAGANNNLIYNSNFIGNYAESGGAIRSNSGPNFINGSIFTNNSANRGSAIFNNADFILNDNIIVDNDNIFNNGILSGSGNTIDYLTNLIINASVLSNKVTIIAKATDEYGNFVVGATIDFYVNGVLVGSAITNSEGIGEFIYTASSAGIQNIVVSMSEFNGTNNFANTAIHLPATKTTIVNVIDSKILPDNSTPGGNDAPNPNPNPDIIPGPSDDPVDNPKTNQSRNNGEINAKASIKNTGIPIPMFLALLSVISLVFVSRKQK